MFCKFTLPGYMGRLSYLKEKGLQVAPEKGLPKSKDEQEYAAEMCKYLNFLADEHTRSLMFV